MSSSSSTNSLSNVKTDKNNNSKDLVVVKAEEVDDDEDEDNDNDDDGYEHVYVYKNGDRDYQVNFGSNKKVTAISNFRMTTNESFGHLEFNHFNGVRTIYKSSFWKLLWERSNFLNWVNKTFANAWLKRYGIPKLYKGTS